MVKSVLNSTFFRNILLIMSGTAFAQVVTFALMPVISRMYTPADFGAFGTFTSVVAVINAGSTLQFSQALVLPKRRSDAVNIFLLSCLSVLLVTFLCLVATAFLPTVLPWLSQTMSLPWIWWALPLSVLFNGLNQALLAWCVRHKAFHRTAVSPVVRSLTSCATQIGFGIKKTGIFGLVCGTLVGDCAANFNFLYQIFTVDKKIISRTMSWKRIRAVAWEYRDFATYASNQSVISAASIGLPVILLAHFYGATVAGYYALGLRVFQVPMALVLSALKQVLFQKASDAKNNEGPLYPLFSKVTFGLFAGAVLPATLFFAIAPKLFVLVFGSNWYIAGEYARWLIFWMLLSFSNAPCQLFAMILRQQRFMFIFEIVVLLVRVSILVLGGLYLTPLSTVVSLSVAGAVLNLLLIVRTSLFIRNHDQAGAAYSAVAVPQ
ncbi:MAG TPA: oligosaccharide flippase family protein [Geomonas sp.]|nr:oligosaccharide flippase family protein [Geomonas sp.]